MMNFFKTVLKSAAVAFSIYSKIPMPRFTWASEDMKYQLCFFPFVGAVIGLVEWLWYTLACALGLGVVMVTLVGIAIPLLVTGGFHVDGFLDTMDALHSYGDREKKLEILKDPHIGAFAVISFAAYLLILAGFASEISDDGIIAVCFSFFIARACSGLSVTYFPMAKKDGMLSDTATSEDKRITGITLSVELVAGLALMLMLSRGALCPTLLALVGMALVFAYYYFMSRKQFGGITGDLAGFFVTASECAAVVGASVGCMICS